MKIAIFSPPWIAIPPVGYGGTERVVHQLTEGLVKKGHEVMLFATGDSKTSARLEYYHQKALGNNWPVKQNQYNALYHIHKFLSLIKKEKFDIIHNNSFYVTLFFLDLQETPFVTTLHGPLYADIKKLKREDDKQIDEKRNLLLYFKNHPFISISNQQREGLPQLNYIKTIYNGVETEKFPKKDGKGGYLAWLGRVSPKKGLDIAIKIALKTNLPLKIAAYIDVMDKTYFETEIKPLIEKGGSNISLINELKNEEEKAEFLGNAIATLFPLRWHEPFGIVMIESMACGTPVIAFRKGSVPEVIEDGKTGFIVNNEKEMIEKIKFIKDIDRDYCHQYAISKFSVKKMVENYIDAYKIVIKKWEK